MTGLGGPSGLDDLRNPSELLDAKTVDALIAGHPVDGRLDDLVAFVHDARALADRPVPRPSPALLEVVARLSSWATARTNTLRSSDRRHRSSVAASVARLSAVSKIAAGALVGATSVAAAGAAGVLPEPVGREVRHLIEITTPIEFSGNAEAPDSPDRPRTHRPPSGGQGVHPTSAPANDPSAAKPQAETVRPDRPPHPQQPGNGHATAPGQQPGNGHATAPGQQPGNGHTTAPGQQPAVAGPQDDRLADADLTDQGN